MYKLGAKLGIKDVRNIKLSHYLAKEKVLTPPPAIIDWNTPIAVKAYQMWDNDQIGDCTIAAYYNMLAGSSAVTGDSFSATTQNAISDYSAITGYNPKDPSTDQGAEPEDVLNYYQNNKQISAWGEINLNNLVEVRQAMEIFGGVYTALAMPLSAQNQVGQVWTVVKGSQGIPGSWGGHMVMTRTADATNPSELVLKTVTWGAVQRLTQEFWLKYCSAAYFFITPAWIAANGQTPSGLNLQAMLADVQELTSN